MKNYYCFAFLLTSIFVFSQKTFSPAYYIDQNNIKKEGFIEDTNPYNSPTKINFKTSVDTQSSEVTIENIKEYKINTDYKFIKYKVDYDYDQIINKDELSIFGVEPNLKQKEILLKLLVEGKVSLYKAIIDDTVFFYVKDENDINPKLLIHRKYNLDNSIKENNGFRKELFEKMKSEKFIAKDFLNINYEEKELLSLFRRFNVNDNSLVEQNVDLKRGQNKFYYKVFGGLSLFHVTFTYNNFYDLESSNSFTNPTIGFEFSNVLGINSYRSEIFGRLFYQKVSIQSSYYSLSDNGFLTDIKLNSDFSSLNLIAGYRYALIKIGNNKLCIDGSVGVSSILSGDFLFDYNLIYTQSNPIQIVTTRKTNFDDSSLSLFFNIGVGYVLNNKYAINLEYSTPKKYLSNYFTSSNGGFSNLNLIFTYTLNK